jgi:hypothetical protein
MELLACQNGVTLKFMGMKGITIKLPDATLQQLRSQARKSGRSVAALVRERVETALPDQAGDSIFALTSDLAGVLDGHQLPATNKRPKFRR